MERGFLAVWFAVLCAMFANGCLQTNYATAKTAAIMNDTVQVLVAAEKSEEKSCIDNSNTAAIARQCLTDVKTSWDPIWKDYDVLRAASASEFPIAFCLFRDRMNAAGIPVPDVYGLCT